MEKKVIDLEVKSNVEESIAGLKALKRQLKDTAAGSAEFKQLYNQIDDLEDKIKSSKNASSDWIDSLEAAGGPLGMLGASLNKAKVATQSFGGALKATGIGLFVSLIGGLVAAFQDNENAMKKIQPLLDGLGKLFNGVFRAVEPLFNTLVDLAINALPMVSKAMSVVYSSVTAVFQSLGTLGGAIKKLISGDFAGAWKDAKNSVNDFGKNYDASIKRFQDGSKELTESEKEQAEKRAEARKKEAERLKELREKEKENQKKILDKRKEELTKYNALQDEFDNIAFDSKQKARKKETDAMLNDLANKATISLNNAEEIKRKREQDILEEKAVADAKKTIQEETFNNISNGIGLLKSLFEKNKGLQKALLIAESAAGIAKIVINTRAANAAAKLKYALLPGGAALAAAEATMNSVAAGIGIAANIAATSKALGALGGGGAPNAGGDSRGGGGGGQAPSFNVVGASATNQLAQTIGNKEAQPIKAYVVSKDMTTQQEADRNIIKSASM